jgi:transposase
MYFLRGLGMSYQSIANEVGVSKSVAMNNIKKYELYANANTN